MNTAAIATEQADESKINDLLAMMKDMTDTIKIKCLAIAGKMADMNHKTIDMFVSLAIKDGAKADWILRIAACVKRNAFTAYHLFGPTRVVTHQMIIDASAEAMAQIADPETMFPLVDDNGTMAFIQMRNANSQNIGRVWNCKAGSISEKDQRERLKRRLDMEPNEPGIKPASITSARHARHKGIDYVLIDLKESGDITISYQIPLKQLKAIFA